VKGRLLVLESPEGAGKTTQLRLLGEWLTRLGVPHTAVREPGGTALGTEIRHLLLDPAADIGPRAEALLFMASRAELVSTVVRPALERGEIVLADRFVLSTYAYQGEGRALPLEELRAANLLAMDGLVPDLTLLIRLDARTRRARAAARGAPDRIERAGHDFHDRVEQAFDRYLTREWQRAHPEVGPIVAVDGRGSEHEVLGRIRELLMARFPELAGATMTSHGAAAPPDA